MWGPHAWKFLEDCAVSIDPESYQSYSDLISLLPQVLPCEDCRSHCDEYLRCNPLPPAQDVPDWLAHFKESVRQRKETDDPRVVSPALATALMITGAILLVLAAIGVLRYVGF